MAELSEITSSDLAPVTAGATACDHLAELAATRTKFATFLDWIVSDPTGNLAADFKLAILNQLLKDDGLADPNTNGWFVRTNSSTGALELVQRISLTDLPQPETDEEDEEERRLVWNGAAWEFELSTEFYGPATSGDTVPPPADGGIVSAAHGLSGSPTQFAAYLKCTDADAGYAQGDKMDALGLIQRGTTGGETRPGCAVGANASLVFAVFVKEGANRKYFLPNKSSFEITDGTDAGEIDVTKWDVEFFAKV